MQGKAVVEELEVGKVEEEEEVVEEEEEEEEEKKAAVKRAVVGVHLLRGLSRGPFPPVILSALLPRSRAIDAR